jgi:hypothetical protein
VSIRDLLSKWSRFRDQETVEFAEEGVAPPDEVEAVEERVEQHRHHDDPAAENTPPRDSTTEA